MNREIVRTLAVLCLAASIAATIVIASLGPSAMVPPLAGAPGLPPYSLNVHPDAHVVIALAALAIAFGAVGLGAGLATLRPDPAGSSRVDHVWPDARRLLLAGCLVSGVLAFLPPIGSADHLNYAAYGRMVVLGHDPYVTVPSDMPTDPVIGAVEEWRGTPSVYGPVATAVQALASLIAGDSVRLTVFGMAVANAAAFVVTAVCLHRVTRHDPVRQRRAALLWTVNPLVIYQLGAGMHLDTLAIAFVVAALAVAPTRRVTGLAGSALTGDVGQRVTRSAQSLLFGLQGFLLGLGVSVKVTVGLVALGPAWDLRRKPVRLAVVAGTATLTALIAYWLAGPNSLNQVLNASKSISLATPWKLVQRLLQVLLGSGAYRVWIQIGSLLLMAFLACLLLRVFSRAARVASAAGSASASGDSVAGDSVAGGSAADGSVAGGVDGWPGGPGLTAPAVAVAFVVAWLFATPYALPWYDGLAFALLAMIPATALDGVMVARLTVLSLAYLPARQADQPGDLAWLVDVVRSWVAPVILLVLTVGLAWWALRPGRRRQAALPAPTRPA